MRVARFHLRTRGAVRALVAAGLAAWLGPQPVRAQGMPGGGGPPGGGLMGMGGEGGGQRFVTGSADAVGSSPSTRTQRQALVEVDEATRTLIVTTDDATGEQIRKVVEALDKPVAQALIKVLFLEVTHTDDLDLGLDITDTHTSADGRKSVLSSLFGVGTETRGGIATLLQDDLQITLRALGEVAKLNVLSRPSVLARNNEEATITIGQEVPFIRNSRVTSDGQTINTVEYEDIGIILTVTPHMGQNGLIEMDVAPEISTLTGDTVPISAGVNAPVFAKRSAETHVIVPSGRTVVIGGLMEDQETSNVRKVPILGDIPWLGAVFRRTVKSKSKTELLIFLTPILVESGQGMTAMTEGERREAQLVRREVSPADVRRYLGETAAAPAAPAPAAPAAVPAVP